MAKQILLAPLAILPGKSQPQPTTIEIDLDSGVITSIKEGLVQPTEEDKDVMVIEIEEGKVVLPGLVDTHVHLNQPGRTEWEGFQTGTLAAISGGVTTVIDMPLNSIPPTTTLEGLKVKRAEAERVGVNCDIGFWGGIIPGNADELVGMLDQGVKGFKCFLIESGVDEFPCVDEKDLLKACEALKDTNALILFHAELDSTAHSHVSPPSPDPKEYSTFLASRPESWEVDALSLILKLARLYPSLRFHIVHLSAASALPSIRQARSEGVKNLTVETCFHYLCLTAEEIPDNATQFKCCPPIRDSSNRLELRQALIDGEIDYVVSDHSPCVPELKKGDFLESWGGISGLGLGLSLLWTEFQQDEKVDLGRVVDWMSAVQAKQVGLDDKGGLKVGNKADWVLFDPKEKWEVTTQSLLFKNKVSPYVGKNLRGLVEKTYLGGQLVWDHSKGVDGVAYSQGNLL
ncbi:allantoinase [Kwoniella mangroviensis CBS 10435]|uniref:allantoinase n=1 Tax=Kwoniella mangroviensis CBS 10435 TaxID=1331196 RepID=A0A1B9ITP4_9TREE|nr:allantoinase [Kwoniella mangroviensis CBS 10435]